MYRRFKVILTCQLLLVTTVAVQAHDYWFEKSGVDYLLHRGHLYSQHIGEKEVPFDPQQVKGGFCLRTGEKQPVPAKLSTTYPIRVQGPCLALVVTIDSGYWSQTLSGLKHQRKDDLSGVIRSWRALENLKRIEVWDDHLRQALASELELVFTEDPFKLSPGDKLRLVAMLRGEPAQGVSVAYDGDTRGVTGEDGRINLRIRHPGPQQITASLTEPLASGKADSQVHTAILSFDLGE